MKNHHLFRPALLGGMLRDKPFGKRIPELLSFHRVIPI
jgi:hypothetical protein